MHQLAGERAVLDLAVVPLHLDVHAEVGNEGAVIGTQVAAVHHILLGDADQHVVQGINLAASSVLIFFR